MKVYNNYYSKNLHLLNNMLYNKYFMNVAKLWEKSFYFLCINFKFLLRVIDIIWNDGLITKFWLG